MSRALPAQYIGRLLGQISHVLCCRLWGSGTMGRVTGLRDSPFISRSPESQNRDRRSCLGHGIHCRPFYPEDSTKILLHRLKLDHCVTLTSLAFKPEPKSGQFIPSVSAHVLRRMKELTKMLLNHVPENDPGALWKGRTSRTARSLPERYYKVPSAKGVTD